MYLVSIIVPIYNVEGYLVRCIDSIVSQSYSNLEIILVNDGSTDSSLEICLQYAEKDSRIKILNKENGGLSSARNAGLDVCQGEYIMFVDSDDWISNFAVENLLKDIMLYQSKLVQGNMIKAQDTVGFNLNPKESERILRDEAISRMLQGEWISACAKLFHRSLFANLRFPVGRTNEDYAILIYIFEQIDYLILNPNIVYFYYTRPGSICTSSLNIHKFDEFFNAIEVLNYIEKKYISHQDWCGYARANLSCSLIKLISAAWNSNNKEFQEILDKMLSYLRNNFSVIMSNSYLNLKYKIFLLSIRGGKYIHKLFTSIYHCYLWLKK